MVIAGALALLGRIFHAGLPTTLGDDYRTYLRHAQLLLVEGRLVELPDSRFSAYPMNRETLSTIGFYLWDFRLA